MLDYGLRGKNMIKKVIMAMAIAVVVSVGAFAGQVPAVCKGINLNEHVPIPPYRIMSERDVYGLCELILQINGELVPVYATKNFVIAGDMYSHRKQITERQIWKVKSEILKRKFKKYGVDLDFITVAKFNPQAKRYVYFITGPLCSYCEKVKKDLVKLAQKYNFGIRLIFYPIHGSVAEDDVRAFVCGHKSFKDYLNDNYFGSTACEDADNYLEFAPKILKKFGVRGVPTIITYKGDYIIGYQPKVILKDLGVKNAGD